MKDKLNIVVISCSVMANLHIDGVEANENANLYGICDTDTEVLAETSKKHPNAKTATDYKDFVNDPNVDAAVIVTPDQFHLEMTEAFLRAGKDVLCEKPMALDIEQCEKMMRIEKETGRKLMIGQICRCTAAFMQAKEIIDAGRIGELFFVESEYAHCYEHARGKNDWRVVPERDGFIGGGCHAVDLLRWIAGDPIEVMAYANHKCLTDWPTNDMTVALYKFPNNVAGKVFCSTGCRRSYTMRSVFYGTKGTIICDNTSATFQLFTTDEPIDDKGTLDYTKPQEIPVVVDNHNATMEIDTFVKALASEAPMPVSSMEGAKTVAVACATIKSAAENKLVTIKYPEI